MSNTDSKAAERALLEYLRAKGHDVESMKRDAREHQALLQRIQAEFPLHPSSPAGGSVIVAQPGPGPTGYWLPTPSDPNSLAGLLDAWIRQIGVSIQLDQVTWQVGEIAEIRLIFMNRSGVDARWLHYSFTELKGCAEMIAASEVTSYELYVWPDDGRTYATGFTSAVSGWQDQEVHLFAKAVKEGTPNFYIGVEGLVSPVANAMWRAQTGAIVPD